MPEPRKPTKASPKVIAVGNLKGGTGKSTVAVNLACALAVSGHRTLLIDTDPQKSATLWGKGGRLPAAVADFPVRDLNAAGEWLSELDLLKGRYARIVIDLPAVVSPALASGFLVADMIIVPTSISDLDVQATRRTLLHVANARRERRNAAPIVLVLPTQLRRRGWFGDGGIKAQLGPLGEPLLPPIRYDPAFGAAYKAGRWIGDAARGGKGHRDIMELFKATEAMLRDRIGFFAQPRPQPAAGTALVRPVG
ncbi:MAG: ParA family protein [Geminicoccaceae bacterium]|nr:ParA family protein [Geminicoccaceae bacterium]